MFADIDCNNLKSEKKGRMKVGKNEIIERWRESITRTLARVIH